MKKAMRCCKTAVWVSGTGLRRIGPGHLIFDPSLCGPTY
jgi:hypothetical protein